MVREQASAYASVRVRSYASAATFIAMIYLLAAPISDISKSI